MIDPTGTTTYQYDPRGQLVEERRVLNNGYGTFKTTWSYNSAGLASSMSYPSDNLGGTGNGLNFSYLPQLTLGAVNGSVESYVQANRYDNAGRVVERKLGNSGTLRQKYTYNAWNVQGGRLQQLTAGTATVLDSLMKLSYQYDPNGNITTIQDHKTGGPQTQTFTYDQLDRLTSAVAAGGTQGNYSLESYIYNGTTGNLASKAGMSYLYQAQEPDCPEAPGQVKAHAVVQAGTNKYCYDQNGNMRRRKIGASTYTLTYDYENQMTGVSGAATASFGYDGDGKRMVATAGGVTTVYIGNWFEYQVGSGQMTRYIYSGSERIAQVQGSNPKRFLLGDHLGSTSVLANQDGSLVTPPDQKQLYKPWGEGRGTNSITLTGYLFTGQFRDGYINLYWMNSRWYDPALSRWVQPDTVSV